MTTVRDSRKWLDDYFGPTDAAALVRVVWDNHFHNYPFGPALGALVEQTATEGPAFARTLLDTAQKRAEAATMQEILGWFMPRAGRAAAAIRKHAGDPAVIAAESRELAAELFDEVCRLWPGTHEATCRGALLTAFTHAGGAFSLNAQKLVATLGRPDPLPKVTYGSR